SAEVRRRVRGLLAKLERPDSPEKLRALRAVEALERAGTVEARRGLKQLAGGGPPAPRTPPAPGSPDRPPPPPRSRPLPRPAAPAGRRTPAGPPGGRAARRGQHGRAPRLALVVTFPPGSGAPSPAPRSCTATSAP